MLRRLGRFVAHLLSAFRKNQGMLLAGAVAYYTLLSIVPLFAVILVSLSHFVDQQRLLDILTLNLELLLPGQAKAILDQVVSFLKYRQVVSVFGGLVVLFFSSMAFTVLENSMSVIFFHRVAIRRRHFLVSAIIPYLFIMSLTLGLLLVTLITGAVELLGRGSVHLFGHDIPLAGAMRFVLHAVGVGGLALILTALYMVMPVGRIAFRHALLGGVVATLLWEVVRRVLLWYFTKISMVSLIYGSLATAIVVLLTLEVASLILLFGAQIIAEVERSVWHRRGALMKEGSAAEFST